MANVRRGLRVYILALSLVGWGCMPKDPLSTTDRVLQSSVRIGVSESKPWVTGDAPPEGIEVALAQRFAHELNVPIAWSRDTEARLFRDLEHGRLDIVICGIQVTNPWKSHVGFTNPYITLVHDGEKEEHVWAVPPGENEWLMRIERFLHANRTEAIRMLEASR